MHDADRDDLATNSGPAAGPTMHQVFDLVRARVNGWLESAAGADGIAELFHELIRVVDRLETSLDCGPVLASLQRRSDPAESAWKEDRDDGFSPRTFVEYCQWYLTCTRAPPIGGFQSAIGRSRYLPEMILSLAVVVANLVMDDLPEHLVASRRARYKRIESLITKLSEELEPVLQGPESLHDHARTNLLQLVDNEVEWLVRWSDAPATEGDVAVAKLAAQHVLSQPGRVLSALLGDVASWRDSGPVVARPSESGAKRLLFVRGLTQYFRDYYGEPLREPVAGLTRELFDSPEVDAATVAKLAP